MENEVMKVSRFVGIAIIIEKWIRIPIICEEDGISLVLDSLDMRGNIVRPFSHSILWTFRYFRYFDITLYLISIWGSATLRFRRMCRVPNGYFPFFIV